MEQERATGLKIRGVEVEVGQHWVHEAPPMVRHVVRQVVCGTVYTTLGDDPQHIMWNCGEFADRFLPCIADEPAEPAAPERWTDAEWAAEQVALARRQAEVARAEARELRVELASHAGTLETTLAELAEARAAVVAYAAANAEERDALTAERDGLAKRVEDLLAQLVTARAATDAVAKQHRAVGDELRAHRDQWRNLRTELGVPDGEGIAKHINWKLTQRDVAVANAEERAERAHERMAALMAQLAETRAALEAARAAVHTPSPGGSDAKLAEIVHAFMNGRDHEVSNALDKLMPVGGEPWSPPVLTPEQVRAHLAEGKAARAEVDKRLAKMERAPEGRDPATRSRALPVVPERCGECRDHEDTTEDMGRPAGHCVREMRFVLACHFPPDWCPRRELAKAGGA